MPAPRRAHECPMSSAGAVRCCCAFLRARLAPLTTAHRQGLEKLGKGSKVQFIIKMSGKKNIGAPTQCNHF